MSNTQKAEPLAEKESVKVNIFQGSKAIQNVVADVLGYDKNPELSWFTEDMYFQSYFYLTKRFGFPEIHDEDYKKITVFSFEVKQYTISIELNSSWVTFMIFGDEKKFKGSFYPIYWVKYNRESRKKDDLLIHLYPGETGRSETEQENLLKLIFDFEVKNNIPHDISVSEFNEKWGQKFWMSEVDDYNRKVLNIGEFKDYEKYGEEYMNADKRHALKTLRLFLKNMLSPIWIRDCAFNIKGRMSDLDASALCRFENNISFKFIKN